MRHGTQRNKGLYVMLHRAYFGFEFRQNEVVVLDESVLPLNIYAIRVILCVRFTG